MSSQEYEGEYFERVLANSKFGREFADLLGDDLPRPDYSSPVSPNASDELQGEGTAQPSSLPAVPVPYSASSSPAPAPSPSPSSDLPDLESLIPLSEDPFVRAELSSSTGTASDAPQTTDAGDKAGPRTGPRIKVLGPKVPRKAPLAWLPGGWRTALYGGLAGLGLAGIYGPSALYGPSNPRGVVEKNQEMLELGEVVDEQLVDARASFAQAAGDIDRMDAVVARTYTRLIRGYDQEAESLAESGADPHRLGALRDIVRRLKLEREQRNAQISAAVQNRERLERAQEDARFQRVRADRGQRLIDRLTQANHTLADFKDLTTALEQSYARADDLLDFGATFNTLTARYEAEHGRLDAVENAQLQQGLDNAVNSYMHVRRVSLQRLARSATTDTRIMTLYNEELRANQMAVLSGLGAGYAGLLLEDRSTELYRLYRNQLSRVEARDLPGFFARAMDNLSGTDWGRFIEQDRDVRAARDEAQGLLDEIVRLAQPDQNHLAINRRLGGITRQRLQAERSGDRSRARRLAAVEFFMTDARDRAEFDVWRATFEGMYQRIRDASTLRDIRAVDVEGRPGRFGRSTRYKDNALRMAQEMAGIKRAYLEARYNQRWLEALTLMDTDQELQYRIAQGNTELDTFMMKYLWGDSDGVRAKVRSAQQARTQISAKLEGLRAYFELEGELELFRRRTGALRDSSDEARGFRRYTRAAALARSGSISDLERAVGYMDDGDPSDMDSAIELDPSNLLYQRKVREFRAQLSSTYMQSAGKLLADEDDCEERAQLDQVKRWLDQALSVSPGLETSQTYQRLSAEWQAAMIAHGFTRASGERLLAARALHYMRHGDFGESDDDAGDDTAFGQIRMLEGQGKTETARRLRDQLPFYRAFANVNSFYLLYDEIRNRMPGSENPRRDRQYFEAIVQNLDLAANDYEIAVRELFWRGNAEWVDTDGDGMLDSIVEDSTTSLPEALLEVLRNVPLLGSVLDPHNAGERLLARNYVASALLGLTNIIKASTWDVVQVAAGVRDAPSPMRGIARGAGQVLLPARDGMTILGSLNRAATAFGRGTLKLGLDLPLDVFFGWTPQMRAANSHIGNVAQFLVQSAGSAVPGGDARARVYSGVPYLSHLLFGEDQVPRARPEQTTSLEGLSERALRRIRTATLTSRVYDCLTVGGVDALMALGVRDLTRDRTGRRTSSDSQDGIHGDDAQPTDAFDDVPPDTAPAPNPPAPTPPSPGPAPNPGNGIGGSDGFLGGGGAGDAFGGR